MSLLECLIALALSLVLVTPLIKSSGELIAKQIEYEKVQLLTADAERALELIGRAIRMAGYRQAPSVALDQGNSQSAAQYTQLQKGIGFAGSDSLIVRHELSNGVDLDCIGNVLTKDRTQNHLALQGFFVVRQTSELARNDVHGGSLMCQTYDRQGRIQNLTLMNGVQRLSIEEDLGNQRQSLKAANVSRLFTVRLEMTDGKKIQQEFGRTFATRNLR